MPTAEPTVKVEVKSDWLSKVNWTQVIGFVVSVAAAFGFNVPADLIPQVILAVQAVTGVLTIVFRTWFTKKMLASSV